MTLLDPLWTSDVQLGDRILNDNPPREMTIGFLWIWRNHRAIATHKRLAGVVNVVTGIGFFDDAAHLDNFVILIVMHQEMVRYALTVQDYASDICHTEQQRTNAGEGISGGCYLPSTPLWARLGGCTRG